jgi:hypothetical protein
LTAPRRDVPHTGGVAALTLVGPFPRAQGGGAASGPSFGPGRPPPISIWLDRGLVRFGVRTFKLRKAPERFARRKAVRCRRTASPSCAAIWRLRFVMDQIRQIEETRLQRLEHSPNEGSHPMVRLLARVIGVGIETADMLVHEILSRNLRDQRAVARYAGLSV